MAKTKGLSIALIGFVVAIIGAASGFGGFQSEVKWLGIVGFAITVIGVTIGFIGVIYGLIMEGKRAYNGCSEAAEMLRKKINHLWR